MSTYFKDDDIGMNASRNPVNVITKWIQVISDRIHLYKVERWGVVAVMALIFLIRLFMTKGRDS
jgi:hypothetical protein